MQWMWIQASISAYARVQDNKLNDYIIDDYIIAKQIAHAKTVAHYGFKAIVKRSLTLIKSNWGAPWL